MLALQLSRRLPPMPNQTPASAPRLHSIVGVVARGEIGTRDCQGKSSKDLALRRAAGMFGHVFQHLTGNEFASAYNVSRVRWGADWQTTTGRRICWIEGE